MSETRLSASTTGRTLLGSAILTNALRVALNTVGTDIGSVKRKVASRVPTGRSSTNDESAVECTHRKKATASITKLQQQNADTETPPTND